MPQETKQSVQKKDFSAISMKSTQDNKEKCRESTLKYLQAKISGEDG